MPNPSASRNPSAQPLNRGVHELPEIGRKLRLICGECNRSGKYGVGRVLIDPDWVRASAKSESSFDEALTFSGIFYCNHCGAGGPWKVPTRTKMGLFARLFLSSGKPGEHGVQFGKLQLFDGKFVRTGAAAEAHLRKKLQEEPDNAYIWGRLGNFYSHAGSAELAKGAYEKAIELDPDEFESLYNLGCLLREEGDWKGAAEYLDAAVRRAKSARDAHPEVRDATVRSALELLLKLHWETEREIPFPPKLDSPASVADDEPMVISLMDVDLSSDEGLEILSSIYLTGKLPEPVRETVATQHAGPFHIENGTATMRERKRAGRNDPCPCGSGKKYKRCCLS